MNASKINFVDRMQHWMDSVPGQTFLNYAYSWGASIVILGTLFKLTHLPGANTMLFIGMGTEVVVFFLSAFDRPFDKQEIGRELSADYLSDEEIAEKMNRQSESEAGEQTAQAQGRVAVAGSGTVVGGSGTGVATGGTAGSEGVQNATPAGGSTAGGGTTIIIGQGGNGTTGEGSTATGGQEAATGDAEGALTPSESLKAAAGNAGITANSLVDIIEMANEELLRRAQASLTPELEAASKEYAQKLSQLTETLDRVEQQSARLTTDSEEMTNLNRTLTGINTVYELQLKSVSKQIGSIDRINEQTRHMAEQIEELNGIYARMIKALTVNMKNAAGAQGA